MLHALGCGSRGVEDAEHICGVDLVEVFGGQIDGFVDDGDTSFKPHVSVRSCGQSLNEGLPF